MMREVVACLIIGTLTLASGALSSRVNQIFDEGETYVRKTCLSDQESKCQIEEKNKFNQGVISSCELNAELYGNASLLSYSNKNVIMLLPDVSGNKIATVNLKSCNVKEITLGVNVESLKEIFSHGDKYYVIYSDDACKQYYCKTIVDSDGKAVQAASPLKGVYTVSDIQIQLADKGFLLNEFRLGGEVKLYFIPYDDLNVLRDLYTVPHGNWFGLSTLENKLGFCAFDDGKTVANSGKRIVCRQYDAEGKKKLLEAEVPIDRENHVEQLLASNALGGIAYTANEWQDKDGHLENHSFLVIFDEHGGQVVRQEVDSSMRDLNCGNGKTLDQNVNRPFDVAYGFHYICYDRFSNVGNDYSRRCVKNCAIAK